MSDNKKQWYLLILATAWLFIMIGLIFYIFYLTHDYTCLRLLPLIAPPTAILYKLYHRYFPPSDADYEIKKLKIQLKSDQAKNKKKEKA